MKTRIPLYILLCLLMSFTVLGWDATRSVSGDRIIITITAEGLNDGATLEETLTGATVVDNSWPTICGLSGSKLS